MANLFDGQKAISIRVHLLEGEFIELGLRALTLRQADGMDRALDLAQVQHTVAIGVELHEDLTEWPAHLALRVRACGLILGALLAIVEVLRHLRTPPAMSTPRELRSSRL